MMRARWIVPTGLALTTLVTAAAAQQPAAQAQANPFAEENMTVNEMVGDWTVRCFKVKTIAPCDVLQLGTQQQTNRRVTLISIAYVPSQNGYAMQVIVPLGVVLSRGLTLGTGETALTGVKFTRCERDGCYVESPLPQAAIDALIAAGETTNMGLTAYPSNQPVNLPVSLKGFADAVAKLRTEATNRAEAPAQ